MKHIPTFESFLNEASAFNVNSLKNIQFIVPAFGKPYKEFFQISFNKDIDKKAVEDAIKAEKGAAGITYEWKSEGGMEKLILNLGKDNSGLTWVFKAVDDFYGQSGEGMGWSL